MIPWTPPSSSLGNSLLERKRKRDEERERGREGRRVRERERTRAREPLCLSQDLTTTTLFTRGLGPIAPAESLKSFNPHWLGYAIPTINDGAFT